MRIIILWRNGTGITALARLGIEAHLYHPAQQLSLIETPNVYQFCRDMHALGGLTGAIFRGDLVRMERA